MVLVIIFQVLVNVHWPLVTQIDVDTNGTRLKMLGERLLVVHLSSQHVDRIPAEVTHRRKHIVWNNFRPHTT